MRGHSACIYALASILASAGLSAQFGPPGLFMGAGNPSLRGLELGDVLSVELGWDDGDWQDGWTSSALVAEGEPPATREGPYESPSDEWEAVYPLIDWSMMYAPKRLIDGDTATPWVEGAAGQGVGEVVMIPFADQPSANLWNGYQKSERLFLRNGRVKDARLILLHGHVMPGQFRSIFSGLEVVGVSALRLRDVMGPQEIILPEHADLPEYDDEGLPMATVLAIEILSVYPGTHYQDTCISEIDL